MDTKSAHFYYYVKSKDRVVKIWRALIQITLLLTFYFPFFLHAQKQVPLLDSLADKMNWFGQANSNSTLYIHMDKNIYVSLETIWFKAYLIKSNINNDKHHTLSVALIRMKDRKVCLQDKFLMQRGLSSGYLTLPDSIEPGRYCFMAYTNLVSKGYPIALFSQSIEIRTDVGQTSFLQNGSMDHKIPYSVPSAKDSFQVHFYPEGGHLISGLSSKVGWQVKNIDSNSLALSAILYEEENLLDTIRTDETGMGTFALIPKAGKRYTVKLIENSGVNREYALPEIYASGPIIRMTSALANDSLKFTLQFKDERTYYVLLHNYRQLFKAFVINTKSDSMSMSIPLSQLPKGLATLMILDTSGRPLAERLFFAHSDSRPKLNIVTDSASYHIRSKVIIHLALKNQNEMPLPGILSVATVRKNRIDTRLFSNIENYTYLEHDLGQKLGEIYLNSLDKENRSHLENILLIKGWTNYHWQDLIATEPADTAIPISSLNIQGEVNKNGKLIKKPMDVYMMNESSFKVIPTTSSGYFKMAEEDLIDSTGKKINLFLNNKFQFAYQINLKNPYTDLNEQLAKKLSWDNKSFSSNKPIALDYVPEAVSKYKPMKNIIVKTKRSKDQEFYDQEFSHHPLMKIYEGKCNDYVCLFNVLNCPNHSSGVPPIQGQEYYVYTRIEGVQLMVYHNNCTWSSPGTVFYSLDAYKPNREFYAFDFSDISFSEPQYITTLYWNASVIVGSNGVVDLSFYTSDIPGTFRIIVQGRINNDVVCGETIFTVKDKKLNN